MKSTTASSLMPSSILPSSRGVTSCDSSRIVNSSSAWAAIISLRAEPASLLKSRLIVFVIFNLLFPFGQSVGQLLDANSKPSGIELRPSLAFKHFAYSAELVVDGGHAAFQFFERLEHNVRDRRWLSCFGHSGLDGRLSARDGLFLFGRREASQGHDVLLLRGQTAGENRLLGLRTHVRDDGDRKSKRLNSS